MNIIFSWFTAICIVLNISIRLCSCVPVNTFGRENDTSSAIKKYKPVIIIPGLFGKIGTFLIMKRFIEQEHPGTEVYISRSMLGHASLFKPMWTQIDIFYQEINRRFQNAEDGIHIIGFSQGGLIARGIIQSKNLPVRNFISLSSPQAGQFGVGEFGADFNLNKYDARNYLYTDAYQRLYSVPGYWNDPHAHEEYLTKCKFLPVLNNQVKTNSSETYKANLLKLDNLVLIGGPDDGLIAPWESSHFSFYDEKENVVDFRDTNIYKDDLIGLKTLDKTGRLHTYSILNVTHYLWHDNKNVLRPFVLPWLD